MADISQSNWSPTDASNNTTPPDGWPSGTMKPSDVEPAARAIMGAVKRFWDRINGTVTSTGSSGTYTIAYSVAPSAYVNGETYSFKADKASAGNDVVNINSLGNLYIQKVTTTGLTNIAANDIVQGQRVMLQPDSAAGVAVMMTPLAASDVPTGTVSPYAGPSAPAGWLLCYGQAVSRTTYATLFAAIGTTYGAGDGSTTFNVPDMRGRAPFGVDNMGGTAANRVTSGNSGIAGTTLGAAGGDERLHQHNHTATDSGHTHPQDPGTALNVSGTNQAWTSGSNNIKQVGTTQTGYAQVSIGNAGAGGSQNMPPAVMLNYIIKT